MERNIRDVASDTDDGLDLAEQGIEPNVVDSEALAAPDIVELLIDPESETEDVGDEDGYESPIDVMEDSDEDILGN